MAKRLSQTRKAALALVLALSPLRAEAQPVAQTFDELLGTLKPGETVWVTDQAKRETKGRVVDLTQLRLVLTTDQGRQEVPVQNVTRMRQRRPDPLWTGAVIGAGVGLVPWIAWCAPATESGETCGDNIGTTMLVLAVGAGAGAGIDALIQGRKTIYLPTGRPSARLQLAPMLLRGVKGARVSLLF